ncbi:MAG: hypothetical protein HY671_04125 [Chloroflexi bacterium]|nr:hypothetical protein [Chloroflexota bacterium]
MHADLPISAWANGPLAIYRWHDLAWAEYSHYLDFQYQNASGQWVTFVSAPNYTAYIGVHMYTQDRAMGIAIDLTAPEYSTVPAGWHRACAWAVFAAYGVYGNGQCSMPVELVRP